jgi:hypothetical protein
MKYKLIKEYPGSPELGTEVESNSKSSSSYFYRSGDKRICVFNDHVEDNLEYWEKWKEFEEEHGNEDTFRELLRIQRSVEIANSQLNIAAAAVSNAVSFVPESIDDIARQAELEALDRAVVNKRKFESSNEDLDSNTKKVAFS